jgi:hypothetical protein
VRWDRAKLILIAVFALLDMFLGWELVAGQATAVAPANPGRLVTLGSADAPGSAIRFAGVLPAAPQRLPTLSISLEHPDVAQIAAHLLGPGARAQNEGSIVAYVGAAGTLQSANGVILYQRAQGASQATSAAPLDAARAHAAADGFLARMDAAPGSLGFDRVTLDPTDGSWSVEYVQRYEGQPVFNGRCDVRVDARGVRSLTCMWANLLGPADSPRPILGAADALKHLADARGATAAAPLAVDGVILGYIASTYQANAAWPTVPAWRVELADGSLYYVNAYTGTLVPGPA